MIKSRILAYVSVVNEDKERCKRDNLGQTVAGQRYLDTNLQQPHRVCKNHTE